MARKKLTDRFVESVNVSARAAFWDETADGLVLRVTPTGAKSWSFVYRNGTPSAQWHRLGSYPAVPLAEARNSALAARHAVEVEKRDPVAETKAAKLEAAQPPKPAPHEFTFADMVPIYLTYAKAKKKTWRDDEAMINKRLLPAWGERPLRSIGRQDVHALLDGMQAEGLTVGCNRYQALISRIFTIALDRQFVDVHPAARMIKRAAEASRDRVLSDDELRALWAWLDEQCANPASEVIRLRMLTGQRGEEIAGMVRSELDMLRSTWTIPGARAKNGKEHVVPLSLSAKAAIERRLAVVPENEPRIFLGVYVAGHHMRRLRAIHDGKYEWSDLRRTLATRLAELGTDEATIGRVLNHAKYSITSKHYNKHAYTDEKRRALDAWDRELSRIAAGRESHGATVVSIRAHG